MIFGTSVEANMLTTGRKCRPLRVKRCQAVRAAEEGINITRTPYSITLYVHCVYCRCFANAPKNCTTWCLHPKIPSANTIIISLCSHIYPIFFLSKTNHQVIAFSRQDQLLFSVQVTTLTAHLLLVHTLRMRGAVPPYSHISSSSGA
jgi:hypothetical protein